MLKNAMNAANREIIVKTAVHGAGAISGAVYLGYFGMMILAGTGGDLFNLAGMIGLYLIFLYIIVPYSISNVARVYLLPAFLSNNNTKILHVYSHLNRLLDKLPVYRMTYRMVFLGEIARVQSLQGDFAAAEQTYNQLLKTYRPFQRPLVGQKDSFSKAHKFLPIALVNAYAGMACVMQNKLVEAELYFAQSRDIFESYPSLRQRYIGLLDIGVGALALKLNEVERAEVALTSAARAVNDAESLPGFSKLQRTRSNSSLDVMLAIMYLKKNMPEKANEYAKRYVEFQQTNYGYPTAIYWLTALANEYLNRNDVHRAELVLDTAYAIGMHSPSHPACLELHDSFAHLLETTDRSDDISDMKRWIRPHKHMLGELTALPVMDDRKVS